MNQFPGKLREYCIKTNGSATVLNGTTWAANCADAMNRWVKTQPDPKHCREYYHASSVRRIEDETAETLRDE